MATIETSIDNNPDDLKLLTEDSNLIVLSSNGFKYLKDLDSKFNNDTNQFSVEEINTDASAGESYKLPQMAEKLLANKFVTKRTESGDDDEDKAKMQEIFGTLKIGNDITFGLGPLEFEAAIEADEIVKYQTIRLRCHASYVYACAHATYFVSVANKFKRNAEDIRKNEIKKRQTRLLNENQSLPGLWIGIIGAGRMGRQLAHSLLEFGDVEPSELRISTRQPEILNDLKEKGVECFFDNRKLATTVNILFLCVLPSQLQSVIDEIKADLPRKCIIYSLVRTIPSARLKNLINPDIDLCIFKPYYHYNPNQSQIFSKWNFSLDILTSLNNVDMINLTNPLNKADETIIDINEYFLPSLIYTLLNICIFLKFDKNQCLNAMKAYVFQSEKQIKIDETLFCEPNSEELFQPINVIQASSETSKLLSKLQKIKSLQSILYKNYNEHFENIRKWKNAYK